VRTVESVRLARHGNLIVFDIVANAFLQHMVRNLVGSLVLVGQGKQSVDWMEALLDARDRTLAGPSAPSHGLYFMSVRYPVEIAPAWRAVTLAEEWALW
jgi:tRNA pseudouridine38-40 synthase